MSLWLDHWPYGGALSFGLLKGLGWAHGEAGAAGASLRAEVAPAPVPEGLLPLPSPLSCGLSLPPGSGPEVSPRAGRWGGLPLWPLAQPSALLLRFSSVWPGAWDQLVSVSTGGVSHSRVGTLQQCKVTEDVPALHCRERQAMGRSHPAQGANSGRSWRCAGSRG